ncbi:hypothetical protein PGAL8A_00330200 [Plasmodium gallinaceum]|uniref:Uncharacterized protein n=1 Tax=Plasmodium gallinaceum TaxID=5849 RepID=A0A1J1GU80_PLAGA|nr:hypothetical protein PGAL8A_00330200 [Plasmodium gallinaceum]CRG96089.1 hypothetical protein PGAL8A_00330200 [Plasmodium gallinaceum]
MEGNKYPKENIRLVLEDDKAISGNTSDPFFITNLSPFPSSSTAEMQQSDSGVIPIYQTSNLTAEENPLLMNALAILVLLLNMFTIKYKRKVINRTPFKTIGDLKVEIVEDIQTLSLTPKENPLESDPQSTENEDGEGDNFFQESDDNYSETGDMSVME